MELQSIAVRDPSKRLRAALGVVLCALLVATSLLAARSAAAQPAHAMAWIFEGPGCRAQSAACADDALVKTLMEWLTTPHEPQGAARSPESPHLQPPRLAILDQAGISARLCPEAPADCAGIMAAYEASSRTVILRDMLDMRRAPDRSFLVHELVHVLQHQRRGAAFQARCSDVVSTEREAYQAQNRYLAAHGQLQRVGQMMGQMMCPSEEGEPVLRMGGL